MSSITLYELLGCDTTATTEQIMAEYRSRVVEVHPDKVTDDQKDVAEKKFFELQYAKELLCDESKRKHYDLYLRMGSSLGLPLKEWMDNKDKLQQTLHWATPSEQQLMLPEILSMSPCKSDIESEQKREYPRRFHGWTSHNSPVISAFRHYQI